MKSFLMASEKISFLTLSECNNTIRDSSNYSCNKYLSVKTLRSDDKLSGRTDLKTVLSNCSVHNYMSLTERSHWPVTTSAWKRRTVGQLIWHTTPQILPSTAIRTNKNWYTICDTYCSKFCISSIHTTSVLRFNQYFTLL